MKAVFILRSIFLITFLASCFSSYGHDGHDHTHHLAWLVHFISALIIFSALATVILLLKYLVEFKNIKRQKNAI